MYLLRGHYILGANKTVVYLKQFSVAKAGTGRFDDALIESRGSEKGK